MSRVFSSMPIVCVGLIRDWLVQREPLRPERLRVLPHSRAVVDVVHADHDVLAGRDRETPCRAVPAPFSLGAKHSRYHATQQDERGLLAAGMAVQGCLASFTAASAELQA